MLPESLRDTAFPQSRDANKDYDWLHEGMTTLTYLAAHALAGLCANPEIPRNKSDTPDEVAKTAVALAKAVAAEIVEVQDYL